MNNSKLMWIKCYKIPFHVWFPNLFKFIISPMGRYLCSNDETRNQSKMDVTRILVRTKQSMVLNKAFNGEINSNVNWMKLVEDDHGPKIILMSIKEEGKRNHGDSKATTNDEGCTWSSEENNEVVGGS